jgi:E3 ubiquitin-protein ligase HUWE1
LEDSFAQLERVRPAKWLGMFRVQFINEPGVDGGGLLREWFSLIIRDLFNPSFALFLKTLGGKSYQPNPSSGVNPQHLDYFEFAGRVFGLAIRNGCSLEAHLSRPFLKQLIGATVSLDDMRDIDEASYQSMNWILNNSVSKLPDEMRFTTDIRDLDVHKQIDLIENGNKTIVTDDNKEDFIRLIVEHRLRKETEHQAAAFCQGFHSLISIDDLQLFTADELDLVICGEGVIQVTDWAKHCEYQGSYQAGHPVIQMFFRVISKWGQDKLSKLLMFTTGSSKVPLGGFAAFKESGRPIIIGGGGGRDRLVTAHTCVNTLDLPAYETEEEMNAKLLCAIENCECFGFH